MFIFVAVASPHRHRRWCPLLAWKILQFIDGYFSCGWVFIISECIAMLRTDGRTYDYVVCVLCSHIPLSHWRLSGISMAANFRHYQWFCGIPCEYILLKLRIECITAPVRNARMLQDRMPGPEQWALPLRHAFLVFIGVILLFIYDAVVEYRYAIPLPPLWHLAIIMAHVWQPGPPSHSAIRCINHLIHFGLHNFQFNSIFYASEFSQTISKWNLIAMFSIFNFFSVCWIKSRGGKKYRWNRGRPIIAQGSVSHRQTSGAEWQQYVHAQMN